MLSHKPKNYYQKNGQKGAILALAAITMTLFFGCAGLAVDFGSLYFHKARLQDAADAAVIAGGYKYGEKKSQSDAIVQIQKYLTNNTKVSNPVSQTSFTTKSSSETKLLLTAEESVPLYFLRLLYDHDAVTVRVRSAALCNISSASSLFSYALLAGSTQGVTYREGQPSQPSLEDVKQQNSILFHASNMTINGNVHTNSMIAMDQSHAARINGQFSGGTDAAGKAVYPWAITAWDSSTNTKNPVPFALGYATGNKKTDYDISSMSYSNIDISLSSSNPLTQSLNAYIQKISSMSMQEREQQNIYYDANNKNTSNDRYNFYATSSKSTEFSGNSLRTSDGITYNKFFNVIIVDGDITASSGHSYTPNEFAVIISLHGNIQLNNGNNFRGIVYAPNGNLWLATGNRVTGSFVANTIKITSNSKRIDYEALGFPPGAGSSSTSSGSYIQVTLTDPDSD